MKRFYYQIKGKLNKNDNSGFMGSNWSFPPIWQDVIEANDKKHAKIIIEKEYNKRFPLRVLKKDIDDNEFLLSIKEIKENDKYFNDLLKNRICKNPDCKMDFNILYLYQFQSGYYGREYCCKECRDKIEEIIDRNNWNKSFPVIYIIKNIITNKCYIGKTERSFTLRWWEHIKSNDNCKFHKALNKYKITDWIFKVIEVVKNKNDLIERERYYINKYDSINNGYNST